MYLLAALYILIMRKFSTSLITNLNHELAALRKGDGLRPNKIVPGSTLHATLATIENSPAETYTQQRAHNRLLQEIAKLPDGPASYALRAAYGLEVPTGKLMARRQTVAADLEKHRDTVKRYENKAIDELGSQLASAKAQTARVRTAAVDNTTQTDGANLGLHRQSLQTAASATIGGLLGIPHHAEPLVNILQASAPAYLDTDISVRITGSKKGNPWYRYHLKYQFFGSRPKFTLAAVLDAADGERLMAAGLIDEYCSINRSQNPQRDVRMLFNATSLSARRTDSGRTKNLPFMMLDAQRSEDLIRSLDHSLKGPCWIMQAEVPVEWQSEAVRYTYATSFDVLATLPYAYWYAPGLMYVRTLKWDYGQLVKQLPAGANLRFMSFTGAPTNGLFKHDNGVATLHLDNWLFRGHSLLCVWGEYATDKSR